MDSMVVLSIHNVTCSTPGCLPTDGKNTSNTFRFLSLDISNSVEMGIGYTSPKFDKAPIKGVGGFAPCDPTAPKATPTHTQYCYTTTIISYQNELKKVAKQTIHFQMPLAKCVLVCVFYFRTNRGGGARTRRCSLDRPRTTR